MIRITKIYVNLLLMIPVYCYLTLILIGFANSNLEDNQGKYSAKSQNSVHNSLGEHIY